MKLETTDGKLRLRSAFKLIFVAWVLSWGALMIPLIVIMFLVTAFGGTTMMNGEAVSGALGALMILPMLIVTPFILLFHALFFGGILTFGLWLYRLRRPIEISEIEK